MTIIAMSGTGPGILLLLAGHIIFTKSHMGITGPFSMYSILQSMFEVTDMSLSINDNHTVFNHMDAYYSCMLGCSYFASPDYLTVMVWIRVTALFPFFINLTGTNICV